MKSGPRFERHIGIDYSGGQVATASLKGLRVYVAGRGEAPPTIVGIDHGFSFPMAYFKKYELRHDWGLFLDDFCLHWPTDADHTYVDFVRDGAVGNGAARSGNTRWKPLTEQRAGSAKSLFHFDVQGEFTHSGLPWLRFIRQHVNRPLHFWPFDSWDIPAGSSAIAEVYPRLWNRTYPAEDRNPDQHDAWVVAEWMRTSGALSSALRPALDVADRKLTEVEGWILGVG